MKTKASSFPRFPFLAQLFANPSAIVDRRYRSRHGIVLAFLTQANGDLVVADVNKEKIKLKATEVHRTLAPNLWIIQDVAGNPIVTMKPKVWTAHNRWEVFKGDSQDLRNLIFTAKTHSTVDLKTKLDVFLANNRAEKVPDFKVRGSCGKKSCTIYTGENDTIIAKQKKNWSMVDSILLEEGNFIVKAYPNADYAFIVALIVILEGMNRKYRSTCKMVKNAAIFTINVAGGLPF